MIKWIKIRGKIEKIARLYLPEQLIQSIFVLQNQVVPLQFWLISLFKTNLCNDEAKLGLQVNSVAQLEELESLSVRGKIYILILLIRKYTNKKS